MLAAARIDWIGLQAQWALRVAVLAGVIVGAMALYFGLLMAMGINPRQFARRG
jgi:putative peptidoglycan lipid II flippase